MGKVSAQSATYFWLYRPYIDKAPVLVKADNKGASYPLMTNKGLQNIGGKANTAPFQGIGINRLGRPLVAL